MKRVFSLLTVLLLVLSLGGCIRKPDDTLMNASKNMEKYNSLSFKLNLSLSALADGSDAPITVQAYSRIMNEEGLMHMHLDMNLAGARLISETYKQQKGFESTVYRGTDVGYGMDWTREEGPALSIASFVPSRQILKYITQVQKTDSTAEIGGRICTRYEGVIEGPNLKLLLKLLNFMGEAGKEISTLLTEKIEELKIPIVLYLDPEDPVITRIELDAAELISGANLLENQDISFSSGVFSVEYGDFDEITEIIIPEEALNAKTETVE